MRNWSHWIELFQHQMVNGSRLFSLAWCMAESCMREIWPKTNRNGIISRNFPITGLEWAADADYPAAMLPLFRLCLSDRSWGRGGDLRGWGLDGRWIWSSRPDFIIFTGDPVNKGHGMTRDRSSRPRKCEDGLRDLNGDWMGLRDRWDNMMWMVHWRCLGRGIRGVVGRSVEGIWWKIMIDCFSRVDSSYSSPARLIQFGGEGVSCRSGLDPGLVIVSLRACLRLPSEGSAFQVIKQSHANSPDFLCNPSLKKTLQDGNFTFGII